MLLDGDFLPILSLFSLPLNSNHLVYFPIYFLIDEARRSTHLLAHVPAETDMEKRMMPHTSQLRFLRLLFTHAFGENLCVFVLIHSNISHMLKSGGPHECKNYRSVL